MDPQRWEKIKSLYSSAAEMEASRRAEFLAGACCDPELRGVVESLLRYSRVDLRSPLRNGNGAFETLTLGGEGRDATALLSLRSCLQMGRYRITRLLGEGGMGTVYEAEQDHPRRTVALKVIKPGLADPELFSRIGVKSEPLGPRYAGDVVARFESERQALALMDHPAIAKVFDAGSTPDGRPYFVMEHVPGVPMTEYCDKHRLTTRQRLELFVLVCDGVQHAHQKAIIHRDLKPSNILVAEIDGKPMPRIIDFGVAKATSARVETVYTITGAVIGTLGYMSPEQADSGGGDVDTRTDVYSLGVVLYELLVGVLPFDFNEVRFGEALRRLREQNAPKPSTKLRALGPDSTISAHNRSTDVPTLARQLQGDADAIVLKALEKDRTRRYSTPLELAGDIGRYLRHEPVVAHAPGIIYRARKYVRRHRFGVSVAALFVILLAAAAVAQTVQLRRVTRARNQADRIAQFMTGMFKVPNLSEGRANQVTAREILDKASKDIGTALADDPELQAKIMDTMAQTYQYLSLYTRAQSLLERAIETQRRVLGPEHPDTLHSMTLLSRILVAEDRNAEGEKLGRQTLQLERRVLGADNADTLASMRVVAIAVRHQGRYSEAETLLRQTLDIQRRSLGPENRDTLHSLSSLAATLTQAGRYTEGEKLHREALEIQLRTLGPEDPDTVLSMSNLAFTLAQEGRYAEAERLQRDTFETQLRVLGPDHEQTLNALEYLAYDLSREGQYGAAEKLFRQSIQSASEAHQPVVLGIAWYNFACAAATAGRHEDAITYLEHAVDNGYGTPDSMAADPDLMSLHGDRRFAALIAKVRQPAR